MVAVVLIFVAIIVASVVGILSLGSDYQKKITGYWTDFREVTATMDGAVKAVEDLSAVKAGEKLEDFSSEISDSRDEVEDTVGEVRDLTPPEEWEAITRNMVDAMESYSAYLKDLEGFLGVFVQNPSDPHLDTLLDNMQTLADSTRANADDFAEHVGTIREKQFDAEILDLPDEYASQLLEIRKEQPKSGDAGAVEQARRVVDEMLPPYKSGGYAAITNYMTPELLEKYRSADPPWDQVSYTFKDISVMRSTIRDPNTIEFVLKEDVDDMGEETTVYESFVMVRSGDTWLLGDRDFFRDIALLPGASG